MIYVMNDYELIDLIRYENDHVALDFMFYKYQKLIWKNVHLLNIPSKDYDDFDQEGMLMLKKALDVYDDKHGKTFTRFFELILKRQFYVLKRQLPKVVLYDHVDYCKGVSYIEEEPYVLTFSSKLEQQIHDAYFLEELSVQQIADFTGKTKKQIYNTIFRIREKYKNVL
jgi:RNA polymerase sporulation-specific sigma factor